jgi:O-antigen ligase/tetratricopeptide (TPR) repeat protein
VRKLLAWIAIAILATYLIFAGGNWWGIYTSTLRILTMVSAAALLVVWVFVAWRNPAWRPRSVMLPAIAACLSSLAISTVFSRYPRISLEYLGYAIVLAALYLLLVRLLADPFYRRRLPILPAMLFVVTAAAFLVRVALTVVEWWSLVGRVTLPPLRPGFEGLTFGNPSAVLTMVVLLAVPTAATFGVASRRGTSILVGILITIGLVAVASGSRAGWFALAVTTLLVPALWLTSPANRASTRAVIRQLWWHRASRVSILGVVAAALVLVVVLGPSILSRFGGGGEDDRLTYSLAALRMFAESPIVGTGPGTWVIQRVAFTHAGEPDIYIPHAHNLESQSLGELGLIGVVAGAVLVANVLWLLRAAIRDDDGGRRRWAWFGVLGLTYFLLHQVLDFYVNMPAFLFAAALPIAYLDATTEPDSGIARSPAALPRWAAAFGVLIVGIALVGLIWQEGPASDLAKAIEATDRGDWAAADPPARAAAAADPDIGSYQLTAGLTADRAGDHPAALAAFMRVAIRDDLPEAWLNLAAEQAELGQNGPAVESIKQALRLGSEHPAVSMPAGDLALRLGDQQLATQALEEALIRAPSLAADSWWREDPARSRALDVAVEAAYASAPSYVTWELALMAGNEDLAASLTGGSAAAGFLPDVIRAWGGDTSAMQRVFATCEAQPLELAAVLWCARIANKIGQVDSAAAFRRQAEIVQGSSGVNGAEFRIARVAFNKITGDAADLWGLFTYRRPAPWDILVPSLVHLTRI